MSRLIAVYDACVLFPAPLRDLLLRLAVTDLFRAVWTEEIHEEWIVSVLASRPDLSRAQLERTRDLMNAHVRDCLVRGYQTRIAELSLPDPDDRHVLAAAIEAGADTIVTFNTKDFPASVLDRFGIVAQHPDEFIAELIDTSPQAVADAAQQQLNSLRNPPKTASEFLQTLAKVGLPRTASYLQDRIN